MTVTTLSEVEDMVDELASTGVNLADYKFVGRFPAVFPYCGDKLTGTSATFASIRIEWSDEPLRLERITPEWLVR
jgi:hypothetical protein